MDLNAVENKIEILKQPKIKRGTIRGESWMWVTDLLCDETNAENHWINWKKGDKILLSAPMGCGKSTFIRNEIVENSKGKSVLILSNRSRLRQQYQDDLNLKEVDELFSGNINGCKVTNITYQALESELFNYGVFDRHFDYVICDECHYFLTDGWNGKTDLSFKWVNQQTNAVLLLMSATGEEVFDTFGECEIETKNYYIPSDYSHFKIHYFNTDSAKMTSLLLTNNNICDSEKILSFFSNKDKAYTLYQEYPSMSSIVVSKYRSKTSKGNKIEITQDAIVDNKCTKPLTISTSCMDNGISIEDDTVKHVVCDITDMTTVIQCIGRRRVMNEDDVIHIYVRNWYGSELQGRVNTLQAEIDKFEKNKELYKTFVPANIDATNSVRGFRFNKEKGKVVPNLLYERYLHLQLKALKSYQENTKVVTNVHTTPVCNEYDGEIVWDEKIECMDEEYCSTYIYLMQSKLKIHEYSVISMKDIKQNDKNEQRKIALSTLVGKQFISNDGKEEIIQAVQLIVDGHLKRNINLLNSFLESENIPYRIEQKRKRINGEKNKSTIYEVVEI